MDLTKSRTSTEPEAVVAKEQHDPLPLQGSGVAAGGFPVEFETFSLNDQGKWRKMSNEAFLNMTASYAIFSPLVVKSNGLYYCGSESVYKALEDKGEARRWLHDLLLDHMKDIPNNWLQKRMRELVAI